MGLGFCDFHVWYFVSPIFLSSTTYEPRGVGTVVDFLSPYLYLHKEVKLPTYSQCGNFRILMSLDILREITIVKLVTSYVNWVVIMPISKCFDTMAIFHLILQQPKYSYFYVPTLKQNQYIIHGLRFLQMHMIGVNNLKNRQII